MRVVEGRLDGKGLRIGIVAARFNRFIVDRLVEGAIDTLRRLGVGEDAITVAWVPGAFEIPVAAKRMVEAGGYDAVICLGAVIRGATPHFDYVSSGVATGVARVSLDTGRPVIFGVLTVDTIEQAIERAGTKAGNRGAEAALAAVETASLLRDLHS